MTRTVLSAGGSEGLALHLNLADLHTPAGDCQFVQCGPIDLSQLDALKRDDFDQALVALPGRGIDQPAVAGIVERARLEQLFAQDKALDPNDPAITFPAIQIHTRLSDLLTAMANHRAALVVEIDPDDPIPHESVLGLLTISDLNRHPFRAVVYGQLASLEAALAWLVEHHFTDPQDWLGLLSDDHQAWLLGYWELSKRRGVDIGPLAGTMLSQLINVVAKTEPLRRALGYGARKPFDAASGHFLDVRNKVMHPVRPLILGVEDVRRVREVLSDASSMTRRVLEMHPQIGPGLAKAADTD